MDQNIKRQWVEALRSGRYQQGRYVLGVVPLTENGRGCHCVMGVLCELAVAGGAVVAEDKPSGYRQYDGGVGFIPASVREWAGLAAAMPLVGYKGGLESLPGLNDGFGLNFRQLADLIEADSTL